jgi:hypothetical protein
MKKSRHMKRKGGYVWPENGKPWWAALNFGLIFGRGFASKLSVVVILALFWAILRALSD